ncbi:MAG TPA: protein-export chaperone SecB [Gemmatimonadaceae bacterium]|nr:protein-export chaperone SecB [Gemmatimonadaceae bacterium]
MDAAREPGIVFRSVYVERIRFDDLPDGVTRPDDFQYLIGIQRTHLEHPDAAEVTVRLRITATGPDFAKFGVEVGVVGRFEPDPASPNLSLTDFANHQAPALVMPFVRELIANITARSRVGPILLPPINILALAQREEEQTRAGTSGHGQ